MAELRNDYAVPTLEAVMPNGKSRRDRSPSAAPEGRGHRGRPPIPPDQQRKHRVRVGMTDREYEAFQKFMDAHSVTDETVAMRKLLLDRLKSDDLL